MESVKSPEGFHDRCHMSWFIILKHQCIQNVYMLAEHLTRKETYPLVIVEID